VSVEPSPTHSEDFEDLAAGYALDALEADEAREFRHHANGCPTCQRLLAEFRGVVAVLPEMLDEVPVSPRVKSLLMEQVRREATESASPRPAVVAREDPTAARPRRSRERVGWLLSLAASLALLVGLGAWNLSLQQQLAASQQAARAAQSELSGARQQLAATQQVAESLRQQLAAAGGTEQVQSQMLGGLAAGGRAWTMTSKAPQSADAVGVVVHDPRTGQLLVHAAGLPQLSSTETYELWVQQSGTMVPAGLAKAGGPSTFTLPVGAAPGDVSAVALSLEPAGGSQSPTGPVLLFVEI
jgi:anti-sigma-K factor RskA